MISRLPALLWTALFIGLLAGCDSEGPVNPPEPADVAGTYVFEQLTFDPATAALSDVNVLDTLVAAGTRLRLFDGGQYILEYQFRGGSQLIAAGDFEVATREVRLTSDRNDRDRLRSLLLSPEMTLVRDVQNPALLTAAIEKDVNLEAYNAGRYRDLTDISGTLRLRLRRQ